MQQRLLRVESYCPRPTDLVLIAAFPFAGTDSALALSRNVSFSTGLFTAGLCVLTCSMSMIGSRVIDPAKLNASVSTCHLVPGFPQQPSIEAHLLEIQFSDTAHMAIVVTFRNCSGDRLDELEGRGLLAVSSADAFEEV